VGLSKEELRGFTVLLGKEELRKFASQQEVKLFRVEATAPCPQCKVDAPAILRLAFRGVGDSHDPFVLQAALLEGRGCSYCDSKRA
jgi:hypothetical protein